MKKKADAIILDRKKAFPYKNDKANKKTNKNKISILLDIKYLIERITINKNTKIFLDEKTIKYQKGSFIPRLSMPSKEKFLVIPNDKNP